MIWKIGKHNSKIRESRGISTERMSGSPDLLFHLFTAPEVLAVYPYGHTADWWSLGILMYAMLVGKVCEFVEL